MRHCLRNVSMLETELKSGQPHLLIVDIFWYRLITYISPFKMIVYQPIECDSDKTDFCESREKDSSKRDSKPLSGPWVSKEGLYHDQILSLESALDFIHDFCESNCSDDVSTHELWRTCGCVHGQLCQWMLLSYHEILRLCMHSQHLGQNSCSEPLLSWLTWCFRFRAWTKLKEVVGVVRSQIN